MTGRRSAKAGRIGALCGVVVGVAALGAGAADAAARGPSAGILSLLRVAPAGPSVQLGSDGTSATVRLHSDPPTMCAVAFGPTTALGRIANDPGMHGAAIAEHTVTLTGLAPGTVYHYRLTATDARGRVYQTPGDLTFRTRAASVAAAALVDVAQGAKVVGVSSQWSADYAGAKAVDGDLGTEWSSAGDGSKAFLTIDVGRVVQTVGVAFRTREMSDGSAITRTFAVIVDGKRYGPFTAGDGTDARMAAVSVRGRVFRFEVVTSTGGNTGAAEVAVYAKR